MDEYFDSFSDNFTNWETIRNTVDLDLDLDHTDGANQNNADQNIVDPRIHLFSRQDISLYGIMPKIEQRIYTKCKDCKLIFNPQDILSHKICTEVNVPAKSLHSGRKLKSRNASGVKKPSFPLPPTFVNVKPKETEILDVGTDPAILNGCPRNKKPRRSNINKTLVKEFDPDLHCGVVEGAKGPCTRSITCSNHRIQMKKLVPGRSKEVQQLIAERRLAKDLKVVIPMEVEEKEIIATEITDIVPNVEMEVSIVEEFKVEEETKVEDISTTEIPEIPEPMTITTTLFTPISPVSIESDTSNDAISPTDIPVTTEDTIFTISNVDLDVPTYKSHPKPVAIPAYEMKKFGGATLFSNFHLQSQRNDVLKAINDNSRVNCVYDGFKSLRTKRINITRNGIDGLDVQPKPERKFSHFVLQYDITEGLNGTLGDGMQENIGFKKL